MVFWRRADGQESLGMAEVNGLDAMVTAVEVLLMRAERDLCEYVCRRYSIGETADYFDPFASILGNGKRL